MSITSDEVNYLVYRYLQESGFVHAAFALSNESLIHKSGIGNNGSKVPPGALITLLQKGLQYVEVEWHVGDDGEETTCLEPPSLISALYPHICDGKKKKDNGIKRERKESDKRLDKAKRTKSEIDDQYIDREQLDMSLVIPPSEATILRGHKDEVSSCAWNSKQPLLTSVSNDGTARIWRIPDGPTGSSMNVREPIVLQHNVKAVSLDWNPHGTRLATGAFDGSIRVWDDQGNLFHTLTKHKGIAFAIRWNAGGDKMISCSVDKTVILWDTATMEPRRQYVNHKEPVLDVDWKSNSLFASCSADEIFVFDSETSEPQKKFVGHRNVVNCIRWDRSGTMLASSSDDGTAKIWKIDSTPPIFNFQDHKAQVYSLDWSPAEEWKLATGSYDGTVKVWDVSQGVCLHTLAKHAAEVAAAQFSPSGKLIASASRNNAYIWSAADGQLVKVYQGSATISNISWSRTGDRLAACCENGLVNVMDIRL